MDTTTERRNLQLPATLLGALIEAVAADRSADDAAGLLRQAGFEAGGAMYRLLEDGVGSEGGGDLEAMPAPLFWHRFSELCQSLGWGTLEHAQLHPGVAELSSDDWMEADAVGHRLGCQLTTGLLSDVLTRIADADVAVLETGCRGRGAERCRFLLGSVGALQRVYERLREGETAEQALGSLG